MGEAFNECDEENIITTPSTPSSQISLRLQTMSTSLGSTPRPLNGPLRPRPTAYHENGGGDGDYFSSSCGSDEDCAPPTSPPPPPPANGGGGRTPRDDSGTDDELETTIPSPRQLADNGNGCHGTPQRVPGRALCRVAGQAHEYENCRGRYNKPIADPAKRILRDRNNMGGSVKSVVVKRDSVSRWRVLVCFRLGSKIVIP